MFENISSDLSDLPDEQRTQLAILLEKRNEYLERVIEVNKRKVAVLMNPSAEAHKELEEYSSIFVAPLRAKLSTDMAAMLEDAIDTEQIKSMLPMVLMGLMQGINFPLALTILGIEPDAVGEATNKLSEYLRSGMQ